MMSQAFYYLHTTTTGQSAYPRSHNKSSRYISFYMLFYHSIVFCFKRKYTLIYFCQFHVWLSEKIMLHLYNNQISLLTVLAVIRRPVYNDHRNFFPQWSLYTGLTVLVTVNFCNDLIALPSGNSMPTDFTIFPFSNTNISTLQTYCESTYTGLLLNFKSFTSF